MLGAIVTGLLMVAYCIIQAQNIGIGIDNPTEKLQVNGIVHSVLDGFRFPDGTLQSTASKDFAPEEAGDERWIIILKIADPLILGSFNYDTLQNVIKIIDYQWGVTYLPPPPGGGAGELTINRIRLIKNIDLSTIQLLIKILNGTNMAEMRLYFYRPVESGMQLYYVFIMNGITLTGFDQQMIYTGGESYSHLDIIELQFEQGYWEYNDGQFGFFYSWLGQ